MLKAKEFLSLLEERDVQYIDFRFTDLSGAWHHMSMPASAITQTILEEGIFFDGSSIPGWRAIHESDMILIPDFNAAVMIDPFTAQTTLIVMCDVYEPKTRLPYEKDPRSLAKRAQAYLLASGIADQACFGSEPEFFIFDHVRFEAGTTESFYEIASDEFSQPPPKRSDQGNQGHRPLTKGGYIHVSPKDSLGDLRAEMASAMAGKKHHHEVAPAQHEIGVQYADLLEAADGLQIYKYVVRNVAHSCGKTATFMPKPLFGDNGSGMHVHQSIWKEKKPLFFGKEYAQLSKTALYYIGGILKHAKTLSLYQPDHKQLQTPHSRI